MKKLLPVCTFLLVSSALFCQNDIITTDNRHEIGVDVGPFLERFLFSTTISGASPYYFTYRYHLNDWVLRAQIGGRYNNRDVVENDTVFRNTTISHFDLRLGMERKVDFARRWQFIYGLDLYTGMSRTWSELERTPADIRTHENTVRKYGTVPFLGFRFKINPRLSLITETTYFIFYFKEEDRRLYSAIPGYHLTSKEKGIATMFQVPFSLFLNYNF